MSKQQRHERKKTETARRRRALARHPTSHVRQGAAALAAAAAIAAGTSAYASPVRFDNTSGFEWNPSAGHEFLDIRADASSQPGDQAPAGNFQMFSGYYGVNVSGSTSGGSVQVETPYYPMLIGVNQNVLIPTSGPGISFKVSGFVHNTSYYSPVLTLLPAGAQTYLGVRFDPGDGLHYGWISVMRDPNGVNPNELDLFAWGYETDPGVSIAAGIPEPGTLAMLALGAAGLSTRRRRRQMAN